MRKSTYIFITFLLCFRFWNITFVVEQIDSNDFLILTWLWALGAFVFFRNGKRSNTLYSMKYVRYMYWIFIGVFISMYSAYYLWDQSFLITLIAQRHVYSFILIPTLLYVQPSEKDILKSIERVAILTIIVWIINVLYNGFTLIDEDKIILRKTANTTDIGYYVIGIKFVVLYLYYRIQDYIQKFNWKTFSHVLLLITFLILYQNRSTLLGVIIVFLVSMVRFKSNFKPIIFLLAALLVIGVVYYFQHILFSLLEEAQVQLANPDYNRWKAIYYYFFDNSPNLFSSIFGNGFPSLHSAYGNHLEYLRSIGIYRSDIGMIGMWSEYGLIPIITIYYILINIIVKKKFPIYMKFVSFHIIFIPIIFSFWRDEGLLFFVVIIYLWAYYNEIGSSNSIVHNI